MSRTLILGPIIVAGVIVSVAMVLLGLPEATAAQSTLLELSALPLSVSLAAGIALLAPTPPDRIGRATRWTLLAGAVISAAGLVMMAFAYLTGPRDLVHSGQVLVFIGLLAGFLVMLGGRKHPVAERFELEEIAEVETEGEADPTDTAAEPSL